MTEVWDAYKRDGQKINGLLYRNQPIPSGLYHLVVEALIYHEDGSLLFLQRSQDKTSFPGYFEASAGGSSLAGETAEQAIRREIKEETGLSIATQDLILDHTNVNEQHACLFAIFIAKTKADKSSSTLQEGETSAYVWVDPSQIKPFLDTNPVIPSQRSFLQNNCFELFSGKKVDWQQKAP